MSTEALTIHDTPKLTDATLLLGFSGWMDGGEVSTGTIEYLVQKFEATKVAEIDPVPFYIYNFPGSMEVASLFRPHIKIEGGLVTRFAEPLSLFYCNPDRNVVLLEAREPNLRWRDYAECLFAVATAMSVARVYFVGTVAGLVPHTRDPRVFASASDPDLIPVLKRHGFGLSNYEGPGSFVTSLTVRARERNLPLASLVAEVPAYVQGRNVKCIETMVRKLTAVANLSIDLTELSTASREFEERLNEIVLEREDLAEMIQKMEADYDQQVSESTSNELKEWLERQGIRLN